MAELIKVLAAQKLCFSDISSQPEAAVAANYIVEQVIAKQSKSFANGEYVNEFFQRITDVMHP